MIPGDEVRSWSDGLGSHNFGEGLPLVDDHTVVGELAFGLGPDSHATRVEIGALTVEGSLHFGDLIPSGPLVPMTSGIGRVARRAPSTARARQPLLQNKISFQIAAVLVILQNVSKS